jgi:transcriptional regulator with XRE-family HTH domain
MNDAFTMTVQGSDGDVKARLAANVRRLRVAHHLSMSELARLTATSKATLSAIENGRGNPTVETLASLAEALGASLGDLLEQAQLGEVRIVRASQSTIRAADGVGRRELSADRDIHGSLDVYELDLTARHVHELRAGKDGSRRGVLVLQGKLIAGPLERVSELGAGDYMSFPADAPQVLEAGRTAVRVLVSDYTPI